MNHPGRDRTRFIATASRAMRRVLMDHARRERTEERKPPARMPLPQALVQFEANDVDLVELDEALNRLEELDPEMVRAVELRFFGGMSVEDTAAHLGMSRHTFERRWAFVRAWLHGEIS